MKTDYSENNPTAWKELYEAGCAPPSGSITEGIQLLRAQLKVPSPDSPNSPTAPRQEPPQEGDKVIGTGFYRDAKPGTFGPSEWLDLLMACQDGRATCMRVMEFIDRETVPARLQDTDKLLDALTDAFLRWPLPASVCADGCATMPDYKHGRSGTNLLTHPEAKAMFREVVLPLLARHAPPPAARVEQHELRELLGEIATTIEQRAVGHAIMYSDRITGFLPRIKAALFRPVAPVGEPAAEVGRTDLLKEACELLHSLCPMADYPGDDWTEISKAKHELIAKLKAALSTPPDSQRKEQSHE